MWRSALGMPGLNPELTGTIGQAAGGAAAAGVGNDKTPEPVTTPLAPFNLVMGPGFMPLTPVKKPRKPGGSLLGDALEANGKAAKTFLDG